MQTDLRLLLDKQQTATYAFDTNTERVENGMNPPSSRPKIAFLYYFHLSVTETLFLTLNTKVLHLLFLKLMKKPLM